jgi:uncharacterized protein (DUF302 family)
MSTQPSWPARTFDGLVTDVARHLRDDGFNVVTDIDVQATLRERGLDSSRCRILSTCAADDARLCKVIVRETADQNVEVNVVDPVAVRHGSTPAPQSTAAQVHRSLAAALSRLGM